METPADKLLLYQLQLKYIVYTKANSTTFARIINQ
jgi:hypothetical protein